MPKKKTTAKKKAANKKTAKSSSKNLSLGTKINKPKLQLKSPKKAITISAVVFILACIIAWWQFIFAEPSRVLSDMLAGNLRTPGVVKQVEQTAGQGQLDQNTYLSFVDGPVSQALTTLEQTDSSGAPSKIVTENIGTPGKDYIKYRMIDVQSDGQGAGNSAENVWASRAEEGKSGQQANFLNQTLFGLVAFGNFDKDQAEALKATAEQAGIYNYSAVDKGFENGRLVYRYNMEIQPSNLISYLAKYSLLLGVDHNGQLNPQNYVNVQPVKAIFTVDVLSRELTSIEYTNTGRTELYNSFGLKRPIEIPTETISIDALQRRLQSSQ